MAKIFSFTSTMSGFPKSHSVKYDFNFKVSPQFPSTLQTHFHQLSPFSVFLASDILSSTHLHLQLSGQHVFAQLFSSSSHQLQHFCGFFEVQVLAFLLLSSLADSSFFASHEIYPYILNFFFSNSSLWEMYNLRQLMKVRPRSYCMKKLTTHDSNINKFGCNRSYKQHYNLFLSPSI